MLDTNRLINALNHLNTKVIYNETGKHIRWTGELPDSYLWAYHPNVFISEKNKAKWIELINELPMPEDHKEVEEGLSLQEVVEGPDYAKMTRKEIDDYARETYGIELDARQTKERMLKRLNTRLEAQKQG